MMDTILVGVANPRGEPDGSMTTFLTQEQLKKLESRINDTSKPRIPLHINHITKNSKGEDVEASGYISFAKVKEDDGKFYVSAELTDNENGKIANDLLHNKEIPMLDLSMGYDVKFEGETNDGVPIPVDKEVKEISICYKGDRDGTNIKLVTNKQKLIQDTTISVGASASIGGQFKLTQVKKKDNLNKKIRNIPNDNIKEILTLINSKNNLNCHKYISREQHIAATKILKDINELYSSGR